MLAGAARVVSLGNAVPGAAIAIGILVPLGWLQLPAALLAGSAWAAALLIFVDVMKELPATLVLCPFGSDTLPVVAYQLARDERLGEAYCPRWPTCWSA